MLRSLSASRELNGLTAFLKERSCVEQNETREQSLAEFRVCQPADVYSR